MDEIQGLDEVGWNDDLYTPREIAKRLKVHVRTTHRWVRRGLISCIRIGHRRMLISWKEVQEKLLRREIGSTEEDAPATGLPAQPEELDQPDLTEEPGQEPGDEGAA